MSTLETQYKNFLTENKDSTITFEEWKKLLSENLKKVLAAEKEKHQEF